MGDFSSGSSRSHSLAGDESMAYRVTARDRGSDDGSGDSRGPLSLLSQRSASETTSVTPKGGGSRRGPASPGMKGRLRRGPS